jgi:hypothetical protein
MVSVRVSMGSRSRRKRVNIIILTLFLRGHGVPLIISVVFVFTNLVFGVPCTFIFEKFIVLVHLYWHWQQVLLVSRNCYKTLWVFLLTYCYLFTLQTCFIISIFAKVRSLNCLDLRWKSWFHFIIKINLLKFISLGIRFLVSMHYIFLFLRNISTFGPLTHAFGNSFSCSFWSLR